MLSIATIAARRAAASRRFWLSSTTLTSLLLPLWSTPTAAQQTASPDLTLPEVVVTQPRTPPRTTPRVATPAATTTPTRTATPVAAPAPAAAPAGNDPLVVSPTGIVTPERNIASSVTVITG